MKAGQRLRKAFDEFMKVASEPVPAYAQDLEWLEAVKYIQSRLLVFGREISICVGEMK